MFDISMVLLERFSLVHCAGEGYYMHPVVHTWTRFSKIDNQDMVDARAQLAIATLAKVKERGVDRQSVQRQLIQTR